LRSIQFQNETIDKWEKDLKNTEEQRNIYSIELKSLKESLGIPV